MLFYDFEVFKYDWLVVIIDTDKRKTNIIINNQVELETFYNENKNDIWVGFNSRRYDKYILQGILCGFDPYKISYHIIQLGKQGWEYSKQLRKYEFNNYDVMESIDRGLKFFEASMGSMIKESEIPFDIDRKLTENEIKKTIKYCIHDVEETMKVFVERQNDFNAMITLINMFEMPISEINKTKVQLSSKILDASMTKRNDTFDIKIPDLPKLKEYKNVADWYLNTENYNYDKTLEIDIYGVPHKFAWGGIHGALEKYSGEGYYIMADVGGMYPAIMIEYDLLSRSCSKEGKKRYIEIYNTRMKLKQEGKKKEQAPLKIVLNGTYGAMKYQFNPMYDPRNANLVCVYGQLLLLELIEMLAPHGQLIQSNTDGVLFKINKDDFDTFDDICYEWEKLTGLNLEFDTYKKVIQKDVNNYMMIDFNDNVKCKGLYAKELSKLDNDLPIVNKAFKDYILKGISVEKTINECDELIMFQQIKKIKSNYNYLMHGKRRLNERCVRVFASKDISDGGLIKQGGKLNNVSKVASTPDNLFIDNDDMTDKKVPQKLNKSWYINMTKQRLIDYGISNQIGMWEGKKNV